MKRMILLLTAGALIATLVATAAFAQSGPGEVEITGVVEKKESDLPLAPETGLYYLNEDGTDENWDLLICDDSGLPLEDYEGERVTLYGIPQTQGPLPEGRELSEFPVCVTAIGPAAEDAPEGGLMTQAILGTEEPEALYGTYGPDLIEGLAGDDLIVGEAGEDSILGGLGDDFLVTGYAYFQSAPDAPASSDYVDGGRGNDLIDSADLAGAPDTVNCGPGDDLVYAGVEDLVAPNCEVVYRYFGF